MRPWLLFSLTTLLALSFAGCLQQEGTSGDDDTAETGTWSARSQYGLKPFEVTLHEEVRPGTEKTWAFRFENIGPAGNDIEYNAACAGPFRVTVTGPSGETVQHEEPRVDCEAIDMKTLQGGESLDFSWAWDARIWTGSALVPAPDGIYSIQVGFEGYHAGNREHVTEEATGTTTVRVVA